MRRTIAALWLLGAAPALAEDRPPAVAGQFYPSDPKELDRAVTMS